ncbi:MAG: TonB family protein [bacterium]|nr:TonB family protein [bacterium]
MYRILLFWLLGPAMAWGQPEGGALHEESIWLNGDEPPYLAACAGDNGQRRSCTESLFWEALLGSLENPEVKDSLNPKGYIILQFEITAEGYMENARIARDRLGSSFADAALRALLKVANKGEEMRWVPFKSFGRAHRVTYYVPLREHHFSSLRASQNNLADKNKQDAATVMLTFRGAAMPGQRQVAPGAVPQLATCDKEAAKGAVSECTLSQIQEYLGAHLRCPSKEQGFLPQYPGVTARFTIRADGQMEPEADVVRTIGPEYSRAIRLLLRQMARDSAIRWEPGERSGQAADTEVFLYVPLEIFEQACSDNPKLLPPPPPPPPIIRCGEVFKWVLNMPRFPGCEGIADRSEREKCAMERLNAYLQSNIQYPEEAARLGIEGTAKIRFIVEKDGTVSSETIVRDPGGGLGEEALRVVQSMRKQEIKWVTSRRSGSRAVDVQFIIPIEFKL